MQPLAEPAHCPKGIEEDRQESADSRGPGACEAVVGEGLQARRARGAEVGLAMAREVPVGAFARERESRCAVSRALPPSLPIRVGCCNLGGEPLGLPLRPYLPGGYNARIAMERGFLFLDRSDLKFGFNKGHHIYLYNITIS